MSGNISNGLTPSFNFGDITALNCTNIDVRDNDVSNGTGTGLLFVGNAESTVEFNEVLSKELGCVIVNCANDYFAQNDFLQSTNNNLESWNSTDMVYACNEMNDGGVGALFLGMHTMNYLTNHMKNNDFQGLLYNEDVIANPQPDKSNIFDGNMGTFGAEYVNATILQWSGAKYTVTSSPLECVTPRDPVNWFDCQGNISQICNINEGEEGIVGIEDALWAALNHGNTNLQAGHDMNYKMLVLRELEENPGYLSNPDLNTFYTQNQGTTLDQLPLMSEIIAAIPDDSAIDVPLVLDANNEPVDFNQFLLDIDSKESQRITWYNNVQNTLNNWQSVVDGITPGNVMETDYVFAITAFIKSLSQTALSTTEENEIVDLAEECVGTHGPAVYVARNVALMNALNYNKNASCIAAVPRSAEITEEIFEDIQVHPNPAMQYIEVDFPTEVSQFRIVNTIGKTIAEYDLGDDSSIRISLDDYSSGVYFVQSLNSRYTSKFVIQK